MTETCPRLRTLFVSIALVLQLVCLGQSLAESKEEAVTPSTTVNLLEDPQLKNFVHFLSPSRSLTVNREEVWSMRPDGQLHISGKGWGYVRTSTRFRDYHLVLEYKWGEHTWYPREDRTRDCGILVHAYGKDGDFTQAWMNSIESQLIEGGSGDILLLASQLPDGKRMPTRLTAEVRDDRNGQPVWTPGGEKRNFPSSEATVERINWKHRDPAWRDIKGYRGARDVENPVGEWNRMEVICEGDTIRVMLNGQLVNEAMKVNPTAGYICLQTEGAEVFVRRYELWPPGEFQESWQPPQRSTDTGYSETGASILPRRDPWSPEESQAAWQIDGDYEMQLVAAEPMVCDPVDVVWD